MSEEQQSTLLRLVSKNSHHAERPYTLDLLTYGKCFVEVGWWACECASNGHHREGVNGAVTNALLKGQPGVVCVDGEA